MLPPSLPPSFLPSFLPPSLPSFLPPCLPPSLPPSLPSFLPLSLHPFLPSFLLPSFLLPSFLPSSLPCLSSHACPPPALPPSLLPSLPPSLLPFLPPWTRTVLTFLFQSSYCMFMLSERSRLASTSVIFSTRFSRYCMTRFVCFCDSRLSGFGTTSSPPSVRNPLCRASYCRFSSNL